MNILVLSEVTSGGEWMATLNLIKSIKSFYPNINFLLIGIGSDTEYYSEFLYHKIIKRAQASPPLSFLKKIIRDLVNIVREIKNLNSYYRIDIIYSTNFLLSFAVYRFLTRKGYPHIYAFHGQKSVLRLQDDFSYRQVIIKFLERLSFFSPNIIVTPSPVGVQKIQTLLSIFSNYIDIQVIPNCIDLKFYKSISSIKLEALRQLLGIPIYQKTVMYIGRIARYKGLVELLKGFQIFSERNERITLIIVYPAINADPHILNYLLDFVFKYKLEKHVRFIPDITLSKIPYMYKVADVVILPSEVEISPLVVLEALTCGTPCIVSKAADDQKKIFSLSPELVLANNKPDTINRMLHNFFTISKFRKRKIIQRLLNIYENPNKTAVDLFMSLCKSIIIETKFS